MAQADPGSSPAEAKRAPLGCLEDSDRRVSTDFGWSTHTPTVLHCTEDTAVNIHTCRVRPSAPNRQDGGGGGGTVGWKKLASHPGMPQELRTASEL